MSAERLSRLQKWILGFLEKCRRGICVQDVKKKALDEMPNLKNETIDATFSRSLRLLKQKGLIETKGGVDWKLMKADLGPNWMDILDGKDFGRHTFNPSDQVNRGKQIKNIFLTKKGQDKVNELLKVNNENLTIRNEDEG